MDETDSGSCPVRGFGVSSVEPLGSASTVLDNACYHLVQNILSSCLLSKNPDIKIYKIWFLTLWEEHILGCVCD
jgi:hypothetical protein